MEGEDVGESKCVVVVSCVLYCSRGRNAKLPPCSCARSPPLPIVELMSAAPTTTSPMSDILLAQAKIEYVDSVSKYNCTSGMIGWAPVGLQQYLHGNPQAI